VIVVMAGDGRHGRCGKCGKTRHDAELVTLPNREVLCVYCRHTQRQALLRFVVSDAPRCAECDQEIGNQGMLTAEAGTIQILCRTCDKRRRQKKGLKDYVVVDEGRIARAG
jgi:hypothetical protein